MPVAVKVKLVPVAARTPETKAVKVERAVAKLRRLEGISRYEHLLYTYYHPRCITAYICR